MTRFDYSTTFGDDRRLLRGQLLLGVLDLGLYDVPAFRDAWVERHQNPDKAPGVGPMVIAVYTESNGAHRDPLASKVFTMRAHPMYREEADDRVATDYTTFYFNTPQNVPEEVLGAMAARAVDPVDTSVRWATALGLSTEENKK